MRITKCFLLTMFFLTTLHVPTDCSFNTRLGLIGTYSREFQSKAVQFLSGYLIVQKRYKSFCSKRRVGVEKVDDTLQKLQKDQVDCISYNKAQLLGNAIMYLYSVPGFSRALWFYVKAGFFNNQNMIKGIGYEFERALELCENGYQVQGFNFIIKGSTKHSGHCKKSTSREFDIIAQRYNESGNTVEKLWIECKNIDWEKVVKSKLFFSNFKQQLSEQKEIVNVYNRDKESQERVVHQLSSKKPIPEEVKQFLSDQGTSYYISQEQEEMAA